MSSPRQNGELADSASSSPACTRIPLATWMALSASSMPDVDVQAEDDLLARDEAQRLDQVAVARAGGDALVLPQRERVRAGRADREVALGGDLGDLAAQAAQLRAGLAVSWHGCVAISSTDSWSSGLMSPASSPPPLSSSSASIALASSQLSGSRIISSSSMPRV